MKKLLSLLFAFLLASSCLTTGSVAQSLEPEAGETGSAVHTIGVATYNVYDAQVRMFREYLDGYVCDCFPDVSFVYSSSISSGGEMMDFLQQCADLGAEGILFFYTSDLRKEVEFCAENGMYCIRPSGNVSDEDFAAVAGNPWFLGEIGPGSEAEYEEAAAMTRTLASAGNSYVILTGGAFTGNAMHLRRTIGILDALQEIYGVSLPQSTAELAVTAQSTAVTAGDLKLLLCPGYMELESFRSPAEEAIRSGAYTTVLSVIPATPLMDALNESNVKCGVIDCFSEDNYYGFQKGKIDYVVGKYQSEIGPAFAALYNAITGHADAFRDDGHAFRLQQGFWTAASFAEYDAMYALARGFAVNAYNYEDLYSLVTTMNPDADFASLRALTEAWTYADCLTRRES